MVAGVRAVLEFAAADPQAAHALTVEARRRATGEVDLEQEAISYFAGLLREVVRVERRFTLSTEEALVESIATIIRGHLQLGTADQLPGMAPGPRLHHADAVSGDLRGATLGGILGGVGA